MKLQFREVHREEIRRPTVRYVRNQLYMYYSTLAGLIALTTYSISAFFDPPKLGDGASVFYILWCFVALVFFACFKSMYQHIPKSLKPNLLMLIQFSLIIIIFVRIDWRLGTSGLSFIFISNVFLHLFVWYILKKIPKSTWYLFYFRYARQYFRGIDKAVNSRHYNKSN